LRSSQCGHFVELFRSSGNPRSAGSAAYHLLKADGRLHWHKVDAEVWHYYARAPIELSLCDDGHKVCHRWLRRRFPRASAGRNDGRRQHGRPRPHRGNLSAAPSTAPVDMGIRSGAPALARKMVISTFGASLIRSDS
jgi:hypothetical protein